MEAVQPWIAELMGVGTDLPAASTGSQIVTAVNAPITPPPKRIKSEVPSPPRSVTPRQDPPKPVVAHDDFLPNPLSPAQPDLPFLYTFNQTVLQRGVSVEYAAEFSGPSHSGRWSVKCIGKSCLSNEMMSTV
jgi:hypothetical protein